MLRSKTLFRVFLIFLIVQSASCKWQPNNIRKETLCDSEECTKRGSLYKANMDDGANPCQDFYTFACGNWLKRHPGPKYAAERSVLDEMIFDFNKIIRDTLESYNSKFGGHILFQKAKDVYEICLKIPEYPKSEASDIAKEIKRIGRLPKTHLWNIHTEYLKLTGESAFFRTSIVGESLQGTPVLIVLEPVSAYGSIKHDSTWKPQEKQAYTQFLFQIIKSLNLSDSDEQINERIKKVFEFRRKFDEIIQRNLKIEPELLTPLSAQELDKWFYENLPDQSVTQDIPWVEVMWALYYHLPLRMRFPQQLIAMRQREYFIDLVFFLKNQPEEVLAFHMEIYFIERHLKFNDKMYKLLEGTSVEPHSRLRYIREKFHARWETCIENHNMKGILEEMLFGNEKWYKKKQYRMIKQLVSDIQTVIYNQMKSAKWLDVTTPVDTLKKLNEIDTWVAFPPWIYGDGDPESRDEIDILKPNAMLNMDKRVLYIAAPLLIPPVFSPTIPAIYNYAGIGTTLGHELYHVIDNCGSYLYADGDVVWWEDRVRKPCLERLKSFVKAYNEATDREFKNRYNVVMKSNTSHSVQENYPDVMGFEAGYIVYQNHVSKDKSICETLPHFEKYNCDQMFYIAFANGYCGYHNKKSAMQKLDIWEHSIESVRVNGVVSQMESFGKVFNCPVGSPMNPAKKVNLWK